MSKKILSYLLVFSILGVLNLAPVLVSAQSGLVPCGTEKTPLSPGANGTEVGGDIVNPCGFEHIFILINTLIDYIFKFLVIPIAAIMFAYAGFLMLFSGGNAGKAEKAKGIFMNVFFGLVIAAASWLIINTILNILGFTGSAFGLEKLQN